jgi:hypothetical protein
LDAFVAAFFPVTFLVVIFFSATMMDKFL